MEMHVAFAIGKRLGCDRHPSAHPAAGCGYRNSYSTVLDFVEDEWARQGDEAIQNVRHLRGKQFSKGFTISTVRSRVLSADTGTFAETMSSLFSAVTRNMNCLYFPRKVYTFAGPESKQGRQSAWSHYIYKTDHTIYSGGTRLEFLSLVTKKVANVVIK